jgi:uncharacterized protein (DUF2141 family)
VTLVLMLLTLLAQQRIEAPVFMGRVPLGTASVKGRILRSDGRPIARATVRLIPTDRPGMTLGVATDADGRFVLQNVAAGNYRVSASKLGFVAVEYGQRAPHELGDVIAIRDGQQIANVDIALPKHSAVVGHVYDESGDPVEGAAVRISQVMFVEGRRQLVTVQGPRGRVTNDQGRFRIYGLEPGNYIVSALVGQVDLSVQGMADLPGYAPTYYPGTPIPSNAQLVTVGLASDVTDVDFSLAAAPTARVSGRAIDSRGEPITGGLTMTSSQRSGAIAMDVGAIINQDGTFIFPNVAPGEYVIQATRGRINNTTEGEFAAQFVTVAGTDISGLVIRTSPGSRMTGRITFEDGPALTPGQVELTPRPADFDRAPFQASSIARADIHDDWTFEISGLNGPRRLRLMNAPRGWILKAVRANGVDVTDDVLTFGKAEQSVSDVEVVLSRASGEIVGTVVDGNGKPAQHSAVIVFSTDPNAWYTESRFIRLAQERRDGTFSIPGLPPGDYYVAAVDRVTGDEWQDRALLEQLSTSASRTFAQEGQTATVTPKLLVRQ